jgi:hypothetical protein
VNFADLIEVVANLVTIVGLPFAVLQFWAGRRAGSASAFISLSESLRQAWIRYQNSGSDEFETQASFADILNLLETGSALHFDGVLSGNTGLLLKDYIISVLRRIQADAESRRRIEDMMDRPGTFKWLWKFYRDNKRAILAP